MTVLVTGANGFLGRRMCEMLAEEGQSVRALLRKPTQFEQYKGTGVQCVLGDITDTDSLVRAMNGVTEVHHLAALANDWARDPRSFYKVNFEGTLRVLAAARGAGVRRTVVASTAATIGPPDPSEVHPIDENHIRQVKFFTEYAASKILAEERIQHLVRAGQDIVITNPTRIFGPGVYDRKNGLILLMDHFLHRPFAIVPGQRDVIGNYVYVDDVVRGHLLAMEKGRPGEKYLLGGHDMGFGDFFEVLRKVSGKKGRTIRVPFGVLRLLAFTGKLGAKWAGKAPMVTYEYLEKLRYPWPVSSRKATEELGYQLTPLEDAVGAMHAWLLAYRAGKGKA